MLQSIHKLSESLLKHGLTNCLGKLQIKNSEVRPQQIPKSQYWFDSMKALHQYHTGTNETLVRSTDHRRAERIQEE